MHIEEITIQNFCSCSNLHLPISNFNPIIGYNNSGKSNILRAVNWLLKRTSLDEHAFHDATQPVIVEGLISGVNLNALPPNQQAQVAPFIQNGNLRFRRKQDLPNASAAQIKIEVFDPANNVWANNPTGLDNAIFVLFPDVLYIQAMDDSAVDIGKFAAKNTLGLLLKLTLDQIKTNNALALGNIQTSLQSVSAHLTGPKRIAELNNLEGQATAAINNFFPGLGLFLDIQTPSLDDLVKGATVHLSDDQGTQRPFTSFGHGAQRTVQMALIKLLASLINQQAVQGTTTLLLIDEPELYLHPQAIEQLREALKRLSLQNFQVIFSTHSPLLLGKDDVLNTNIIYKANNQTVARTKLSNAVQTIAANTHQSNVIFSIENSTYLLFSEKVVLVEGKTETMILPQLVETLSGSSLNQSNACMVSATGSGSILPMMSVLSAVGFTPKAVVDLDFIFKNAHLTSAISKTDQEFVACKNWFASNQHIHAYALGTEGFPERKDKTGKPVPVQPEEAFELMAQAMPQEVDVLANKLAPLGIWIWRRGAIESYLGIDKNDSSRLNFLMQLKQNQNANHATYPAELEKFVDWL